MAKGLLTIFGYHHIRNKPNDSLSDKLFTSPHSLRDQVKLLQSLEVKIKSLSYFYNKKINANNHFGALTFDDAYIDFYKNAFPILSEARISATLFVIVDKIGHKDYCTKEMLNEMINYGIEIGSHTITHPLLTSLTNNEVKREINDSKLILEDMFSVEVNSFCYPYGDYNDSTVEMVKNCGYSLAVTTNPGLVNPSTCNWFTLNRIAAEYCDTRDSFKFKLLNGMYM